MFQGQNRPFIFYTSQEILMSLPRLTGSQEKNTALIIYPFFYVAHQVAENEIFSQTGLRSNKCLFPEKLLFYDTGL